MAYSKAKLKSNGDRASPCFKPFLIANISDTRLTVKKLRNERGKMHRGLWWENPKERHNLDELGVDGKFKLKWMFKKQDGKV